VILLHHLGPSVAARKIAHMTAKGCGRAAPCIGRTDVGRIYSLFREGIKEDLLQAQIEDKGGQEAYTRRNLRKKREASPGPTNPQLSEPTPTSIDMKGSAWYRGANEKGPCVLNGVGAIEDEESLALDAFKSNEAKYL